MFIQKKPREQKCSNVEKVNNYEDHDGYLSIPFFCGFGIFCPVPKHNHVASTPVPWGCVVCAHSFTQRASRASRPGLGRAERVVCQTGPTRNWERRRASDSIPSGEMARGISPAASDGSSVRSTPRAKHALPGTVGPPAAPESQGGAGSSSHRATIVLTSPLEALALPLPSVTLLSPVPQAPPSGRVRSSTGAASLLVWDREGNRNRASREGPAPHAESVR